MAPSTTLPATGRQLEYHPAANLFPMMSEEEIQALAEDIKANGQRVPIVLHKGQILDGRNRYEACTLAGVEPRTVEWDGRGGSAVKFVWSLNRLRRQLSKSQQAMVAADMADLLKAEANERRKDAMRGNQNAAAQNSRPTNRATVSEPDSGRSASAAEAAEEVGVSRAYVESAQQIKRAAESTPALAALPEEVRRGEKTVTKAKAEIEAEKIKAVDPVLAEKVRKDEVTIDQAKRELKRREVKEKLDTVAAQHAEAPTGEYDVLVVDPPWPIEKIERDCRPNQVALDYPTMSLEEIKALAVPAAADAHLWLWTTHRFLPASFDVLSAWGFKYVCAFTWKKPGGFQPVGLPQFNCEFALYARKGSPQFVDTKALAVCFEAPRGKHSEKPEEFYELLRRVTGGRRLDMFNRRKIDGFDSFGKEASK